MAWIEPRRAPSGKTVYYVRWRENGRVISTRRRTRGEADQVKRQIESAIMKGTYVPQELRNIPFGQFATQTLEADYRLGPEARRNYETCIRRQLSALEGRPISAIDGHTVRKLFRDLENDGASDHTLVQTKKTLSKIFSYAMEEGIVTRNPAKAVRLRKPAPRKVRILSPERIEEVSLEVPRRYRAAVLLGGWCGLRIGEVGGLDYEDFSFAAMTVNISKAVTGNGRIKEPKTRTSRRVVHVPHRVAQIVAGHQLEFAMPGQPLFTTESGSRINSQTMSRIMKPTGVTFHELRHTQAALLIQAGAHPKEIQERMGHASITTTFDVYGHLFPERPQELAAKLDQFAPRPMGEVIEL
jgi:integrase